MTKYTSSYYYYYYQACMYMALSPKNLIFIKVELLIADESIQRQLARWGHTFTAITHSEGLVEVIMFGGSPGYYGVSWDVYKRKDFGRLSFPASFIFGEP